MNRRARRRRERGSDGRADAGRERPRLLVIAVVVILLLFFLLRRVAAQVLSTTVA